MRNRRTMYCALPVGAGFYEAIIHTHTHTHTHVWIYTHTVQDSVKASDNQSSQHRRLTPGGAQPPAYAGKATYPLDQACNGWKGTCAMEKCVTLSTEPTCIFEQKEQDAAAFVKSYTCQARAFLKKKYCCAGEDMKRGVVLSAPS